jgi:alanyl-tRNA synthetase
MTGAFLNTSASLPPTIKMFHADPYRSEATAKVLFVKDDLVVTDQSIFYAESGGQVPDTGTIDGVGVVDVQKQGGHTARINHPRVDVPMIAVDTFIVHRLDRPASFAVGDEVAMKIDWHRRYLNMRYHSAAHFLFHAVRTVVPCDGNGPLTRGCHIHSESARFDYFDPVPAEAIEPIERLANELIDKGLTIRMEREPHADDLLYWIYDDIIIPCGGTHVRSARELGPIAVSRRAKGKNNTRVYCTFKTQQ